MKNKKNLLIERFQELAGIKPISELSPELKAKAAMAAKSQGRNQQADRFGKSYGEEEQDDSAFKAFIGKELGAKEDYMIKITNIDIEVTVATVRLESDNWSGHTFTDFFTLLKLDNQWKIMNKVFHLHK